MKETKSDEDLSRLEEDRDDELEKMEEASDDDRPEDDDDDPTGPRVTDAFRSGG